MGRSLQVRQAAERMERSAWKDGGGGGSDVQRSGRVGICVDDDDEFLAVVAMMKGVSVPANWSRVVGKDFKFRSSAPWWWSSKEDVRKRLQDDEGGGVWSSVPTCEVEDDPVEEWGEKRPSVMGVSQREEGRCVPLQRFPPFLPCSSAQRVLPTLCHTVAICVDGYHVARRRGDWGTHEGVTAVEL